VLTPVFHDVRAMAILLVEKVHKVSVEETLSTIMGADCHDPPILSLVLIPLSSRSIRSSWFSRSMSHPKFPILDCA
jgi:hypothetical protein